MSDLYLHGVTLDELAAKVAEIILPKIVDALSESREPRLVGRDRMAELLGVSLPTLDRMIQSESIPSIAIGTRRMFQPSAVIEALADSQAVTA